MFVVHDTKSDAVLQEARECAPSARQQEDKGFGLGRGIGYAQM